MKGGNAPLGYTIIEVMIVLAISGFMFAIAANFINGKQATTAFSSGSSEMISRLQGVIEQVRDGRYSDVAFTCTRSLSDPPQLTIATAPTDSSNSYTGKNAACTFIGKFVHFPIGVGVGQELTDYRVFSLAGAQLQANGNPVTTLAQAGPTVIRSGDGPTDTDLTTQVSTPQNLDVKSVRVNNGAAWVPAYGFGFVQGLGSVDTTVNPSAYLSGSQTIRLVYAPGITKDDNQLADAASALKTGGLTEVQGAEICFTDGTRYARISVGVNQEDAASAQKDAPLTIKRKMLGRTAC